MPIHNKTNSSSSPCIVLCCWPGNGVPLASLSGRQGKGWTNSSASLQIYFNIAVLYSPKNFWLSSIIIIVLVYKFCNLYKVLYTKTTAKLEVTVMCIVLTLFTLMLSAFYSPFEATPSKSLSFATFNIPLGLTLKSTHISWGHISPCIPLRQKKRTEPCDKDLAPRPMSETY